MGETRGLSSSSSSSSIGEKPAAHHRAQSIAVQDLGLPVLKLTDDELDTSAASPNRSTPTTAEPTLSASPRCSMVMRSGQACFTAVASKLNLSCGNRPPSTGVAVRPPRTRNRRARAAAAVSADRAGRGGGYPTSNRTAVRHSASAAFPSGRCIWSKRRNANGTGEGRP